MTDEEMAKQRAFALEKALEPYAIKLGIKVRAVADVTSFAFKIYAAMSLEREVCAIDEEMLILPRSKALADLLFMELENLQLRLHDNAAEHMNKHDVRERCFALSREDKALLHDMYIDACSERMRDFSRAEAGSKKTDQYAKLMDRLYR